METGVIYARVSSKEQELEGYSIPAQLKLLREYAQKNNITVIREFTEVETAKKAGRTQFSEMLIFIKNNLRVKNLLAEKPDRLLRNTMDLALLEELMAENGIKIHTVKDGKKYDAKSSSSEKFMFGIQGLMAKQVIDNLSEEVKKGMQEKAAQGTYPSRAPFGYLNAGTKGKRSIVLDPVAAPYIKRMFELYATVLYSLAKLRQQMVREGIVFRNGKNFHKSMVESLLKNEFYTGVFYWKGVKCEKASHPAIISKELFNQVQRLMMNPKKSKSRKGLFPYTSLIKCGHCGCDITAEIHEDKYIYYRCTNGKGKCIQKYVRQEVFDTEFEALLDSIHVTKEAHDIIMTDLRESFKEKKEYLDHNVKTIEQQIGVLQKRIDTAYTDRVDGKIDEAFWKQHTSKWILEKEELAQKLLSLQKVDTCFMENANMILELAKNASRLFKTQNAEEKRKLINLVLSKCILKDGKLELELAEPFNQIKIGRAHV